MADYPKSSVLGAASDKFNKHFKEAAVGASYFDQALDPRAGLTILHEMQQPSGFDEAFKAFKL